MSISVRCPDCDATFRVSDEKSGKKLRCRQCGGVLLVGDDFKELDADEKPLRRLSSSHQRRSSGNATPPPWMAIVGIAAGVFVLLLMIIFVKVRSSSVAIREWKSEPASTERLDREVNLNGFAIRPPRNWPVTITATNGVISTAKYTWQSLAGDAMLVLEFRQDARYHPNYEPMIRTTPGAFLMDQSIDVYSFDGATHDRGIINGQKFQRIFSPQEPLLQSSDARSIYLSYLVGTRIELQISSKQGERSESFKTLEASALSFRIGLPSDPLAVPVQQLLAPNPDNGPSHQGRSPVKIANTTGVRRSPAMANGNGNGNGNAAVEPQVPKIAANPIVKKSGAIPELSNVVGGRTGFLPYAYQRPELPGVYHIYPDESYQPKVVIPFPSGTVAMSRPVTPSDFLLVGSQVWNVKTAERVASLELKINQGDFAALSPDGKLLAFRERSKDTESITIFSTEQSNPLVELAARKGNARLEWLGFLDATRLMVVWSRWNDTRDNAVQIWNAASGEGLSAFGLGAFDRDDMSVSSDGEQMLFHTSDAVGYVSLSPKKPKPTPLPMPDRRALGSVNGMAFSSDNTRAAIYRGGWEGISILEWDVTKKKVAQNGTVPINAHDIAFNAGVGDAFQWTPDGSHWLIKGHLLLECKTGNPVWMLQSLFAVYASPIMLDQDTLLVPVQTKNHENFLVSVPFPWKQIRQATAAMNDSSQPALLRPGTSVSMEFNPGPLRFMEADQMAQVLGQPLADRLKTFGIKVEADQPTVLYVKYQEQTGDALQVVQRRSPFDFRGTPTGQTVNETKYQLEIGWKQAGTGQVFWKTTSQGSTARSSNTSAVSDQSIHQEMVDRLKRQLNSLMIPYFIPEDNSIPLLPVISAR